MSTHEEPKRNWQEIAHELAHEQNPSKCLELSLELNQAITEEERKGGGSWLRGMSSKTANRSSRRTPG